MPNIKKIIVVSLLAIGSYAQAARQQNPSPFLAIRVNYSSLSDAAVEVIYKAIDTRDLNLINFADVIAIPVDRLNQVATPQTAAEILDLVHANGFHLAGELTPVEAVKKIKRPAAPRVQRPRPALVQSLTGQIDGATPVDALGLSPAALRLLQSLHVIYIEDTEDLTLEDLADTRAGSSALVPSIAGALSAAGFPMARDNHELQFRKTKRDGDVFIGDMDLPLRTMHALEDGGIFSLFQLRETTRIELARLADLGPLQIKRIESEMVRRGVVLYEDALELTVQRKVPLDLKKPIGTAIAMEPAIGKTLVETLGHMGIRTLGQLIKADRKRFNRLNFNSYELKTLEAILPRLDQALAVECTGLLGG